MMRQFTMSKKVYNQQFVVIKIFMYICVGEFVSDQLTTYRFPKGGKKFFNLKLMETNRGRLFNKPAANNFFSGNIKKLNQT